MKSAIRMFALLVAVAGLGAAAIVPATTHAQSKHASILATSPAAALPAPPCSWLGCVESASGR